jgi:hypothetical protein
MLRRISTTWSSASRNEMKDNKKGIRVCESLFDLTDVTHRPEGFVAQ